MGSNTQQELPPHNISKAANQKNRNRTQGNNLSPSLYEVVGHEASKIKKKLYNKK